MNMKAPRVTLPELPIEHFRCVPRGETLLRTACASNYARVAVTGRAAGQDKHCSGCTIGAVHSSGHVPTHKAPAVAPPKDAEPVETPRPTSKAARPAAPAQARYARCEVGGHSFPCSPKGRVPKRCGEHRGYAPPLVPPKAPSVHETPAPVQKRPPSVQPPARVGRPPLDAGEARDSTLSVRTSEADRARIDAAAERAGLTTSEWARRALLGAATIVGVP